MGLEVLMKPAVRYLRRYHSVTDRPLAVYSEIRDQPRRACTPDPYTADNAHYRTNFGRSEDQWAERPVKAPDTPLELPAWS